MAAKAVKHNLLQKMWVSAKKTQTTLEIHNPKLSETEPMNDCLACGIRML